LLLLVAPRLARVLRVQRTHLPTANARSGYLSAESFSARPFKSTVGYEFAFASRVVFDWWLMKLVAFSILVLAVVVLVIGWRATTHHHAKCKFNLYKTC
jgi:hypothetical protein